MLNKKILGLGVALLSTVVSAAGRDTISVVGSSTVYPFSTVVAERFGKSTDFSTPKIESTGTGGGMKLFCAGVGVDTPDMSNASRRIKASELEMCQANGVKDVVEVLVGYDGIVISNAIGSQNIEISLQEIFLALAQKIPNPDGSETLVENPYTNWAEINPALPDTKITVYGPPPTSGTRDAFAELALEGGCQAYPWIKSLKKSDKNRYKTICHSVREDGAYIESGENDNLIVQKLTTNPVAFGVFGFSFLDQNSDTLQGSKVSGAYPTFEAISDGSYPISRPLYFYVKKAHVGKVPGILEFLTEFTSDDAIGEEGYTTDKGLIPLNPEKLMSVRKSVLALESMTL
ncbi:MAG: PstS family phosphate ABC transporter substrate-binding protein [Gammaproteobacteria bacterium]|nr:PstS family phosphate ABC transporter substrate-binding protein [Gammaproteobacteria bacterium]NNJ71709.1 PstS family phosphate ABC transporter substrate-binding protein [Enterobacterales bacterium]